ncbi:MAG: CDP-alcohol phosphatidyltransferase family protein [Acidobacteria bacterium]|nr:CDP-alcohol phosphatidyltransferase family protein [Acidobacteriota bacterium]
MCMLGAGWRRQGLQQVGGLTLLGRALLALDARGVERIAVVGESPIGRDPAFVARALGRRRVAASLVYVEDGADLEPRVALALNRPLASPVVVLPRPILANEAHVLNAAQRPIADLGAVRGASPDPAAPLGDDERQALERRLFAAIRKPITIDGAVAWLVLRPVSRQLTRLCWRTPITPNQISIVALLLGVASGPVVALGGRTASVAGALLLAANLLLDCVDGELARLTHRTSRLGEWLDTIGDDASLVSYLLGLGAVVPALPLGVDPLEAAWAAAALFAATSLYVYGVLVRRVGTVDTALYPHARAGRSLLAYAMKRDFFVLLFLVLAIAGREWISLSAICLGTMVNAAGVFGTAALGRRAAGRAPE